MSKDFRASQIETSKIIASGSLQGVKHGTSDLVAQNLGIAMYSGSVATNREGGIPSKMLDDVGSDVFFFVSGSISNKNFTRKEVTLFGGDVVVSGTIYAERQVIEVDGVVDGDMIVTGSLRVEPDADGVDSVVFRNAAGSLDLFSVNTSAQASVVINESSGDVDFRVETNDETHMIFVEGSTNRVSIGDSVDSPAATLEVTNHASAGAFDVPLVQLNSNDVDKVSLDINATNTTANIIDVTAQSLTSGNAVFIDHHNAETTNSTPKSIHVDYDKSGVVASGQTHDSVGFHVEMNDAATNHASSAVIMSGVEIDVVSANNTGTTNNVGVNVSVTGADTNEGVRIIATDGAGSDIKMMSSANNSDFATIAVGANGETTITTVDDSTGTSANLNFVVDGATDIQSTGNVTIDSSAGTIGVGTDEQDQTINIGTGGNRSVNIGKSGGTSTVSIYSKGGTLALDATNQEVNIDSAAFDVNASGAVTIDGTSTLSIDSADSTNLTMAVNAASTKTLTISATNADGSNVSNIDVDADGALTLNGAGGATFGDDTEAIVYDGSGNVDFDAVSLDLDVTDSSSITITSSEAGEDLTIEQVGGNDSSIIITAAGTGTDAIKIDATAGDMVIGPSLADGKTLKLGKASAAEITIAPHNTAANEKITVTNTAGTADDAIKLESTAGGVTILAGNDSLVLDANGTDSDAINIDSAGGIDIDSVGAITIDGSSTFSIDGVGASNLTTNGGLTVSGSTNVSINSDSGIIIAAGSEVFDIDGGGGTAIGTDVKIMLSGSIGSRGTATRGTTSLTGDANISGSFGFSEVASVPSHSSNQAILYAKDDSGVTKLFMKQSDGVEVGPLGSGGALDDAYDTPIGGGTKSPGVGAIITVDSQPVQIKVAGASKTALAITGSVIIGSGSNGLLPDMPGNDTNFFVSGSIGSRGTSVKGASIFGGDVVVSGTLSVNRGQAGAGSAVTVTTDGKVGIGTDNPSYKLEVGGNASFGEYLYHRNNSGGQNTFMRFEDDKISFSADNEVLLTADGSGGQDVVTIGDGGDVDFTVRSATDDDTDHPALHVQGNTGRLGLGTNAPTSILHIEDSTPTVTLQRQSNSNSSTIQFLGLAGHQATMAHLGSTNDLIFTTHDGSDQEEILRLGGFNTSDERRVVLLSGSGLHAGAMHPSKTTDINFFVSGAMMSRGTATKGTAVFGGDLLVSGGVHVNRISAEENANTYLDFTNRVIQLNVNNKNFVNFSEQDQSIFFNPTQRNDISTVIMTDNKVAIAADAANDRVLILSGGGGSSYDEAKGADVNFYVSGSVMSRGTATKGTSVFGGDLVVSGAAYAGRVLSSEDSTSFVDLAQNTIEINANHSVLVHAAQAPGNDTNFFVSGSINSVGTNERGTAVFGGDVVVSGSILSKKMIDVKTFCPNLNNSTLVMFLPNPNRTAASNTNINDHTNMLMPFSGSITKMTMDVQSSCVVGISLHKAQDETAISHFTASFANNEILEFNFKNGLTGSYSSGAVSPANWGAFSGSFDFDPGDQLAIGIQKKSGSVPGTSNINLVLEYDVVSKTLTGQ